MPTRLDASGDRSRARGVLSPGRENFHDDERKIRPWARDATVPPDVFAFTEHLGSNFYFFKLTEGDDPPVYFWEEGEGGLEVAVVEQETFSQFLLTQVRLSLSLRST